MPQRCSIPALLTGYSIRVLVPLHWAVGQEARGVLPGRDSDVSKGVEYKWEMHNWPCTLNSTPGLFVHKHRMGVHDFVLGPRWILPNSVAKCPT